MRWIIVTGDSGDLGGAVTKEILRTFDNSFGVIGLSRRQTENINMLKSNYSDRYKHINYDLSDVDGVKDLFRNEIHSLGHIYGLVNNAANAYDDIVTNLHSKPLRKMFDINVFSGMMLTKYAIRDMLVTGTRGSLVHISSVSAHTGYKGLAMYAASKGALEAFSLGTAREWGAKGIRSNIVAPGFMETAISSKLNDEQRVKIYQRTSLKNATQVESVAKTIVFLLSDAAASITGSVVRVDNGTV